MSFKRIKAYRHDETNAISGTKSRNTAALYKTKQGNRKMMPCFNGSDHRRQGRNRVRIVPITLPKVPF